MSGQPSAGGLPSLRGAKQSGHCERSNPVRGPSPTGLLRRFAARNDDGSRDIAPVTPLSLRAERSNPEGCLDWIASPFRGTQ
ncbi:MAG: hypothetical protein LBT00_08845 [Spirochaetaceae bacterium]|nr:hypothetical protein [Spirochaetaceae bacterium]